MDWVKEFTAQKLADSHVEEGTFNEKMLDGISGGYFDDSIKAIQAAKSIGINNSLIKVFMKVTDGSMGLAPEGSGVGTLICNFILDHWEDEEIKRRRGRE